MNLDECLTNDVRLLAETYGVSLDEMTRMVVTEGVRAMRRCKASDEDIVYAAINSFAPEAVPISRISRKTQMLTNDRRMRAINNLIADGYIGKSKGSICGVGRPSTWLVAKK